MKSAYTLGLKRPFKRYVSKRNVYCVFILSFIMIIAMQFRVMPYENMDYVRHIELIDNVRHVDQTLWEYLVDQTNKVYLDYRFLYLFNMLLYICAKITDNNYLLSWICTLITYGSVLYIALDWKAGKKYTWIELICNVLVCFALLPFIHVVSGLRTGVASAIIAVGIYGYLYKKKSLVFFVLHVLAAATCHSFILLSVPFVFLTKFDLGRKGFVFVLCATASLQTIAQYLYQNASGFLYAISRKYVIYNLDTQHTSWRFVYYTVILTCVLMLLYHFTISAKDKHIIRRINAQSDSPKYELYRFLAYYACFIIGNFQSYEMITRQGYILGILAPIIATFTCENTTKSRRFSQIMQTVIRMALTAITVYASVRYILLYYKHFV